MRTGLVSSRVPRVFSTADLSASDQPRWRVIDGDGLLAPQFGVRMDPNPTVEIAHPAWADDEWFIHRARLAAVQARRPDAIGSHNTAALMHGIPLPTYARTAKTPLHVLTGTASAVRLRGVVGHRGALTEPTTTTGSVEICGAIQTLVQLAPILMERDLIVAVEALIGKWRCVNVSVRQIEDGMINHPGARGLVRLRNALICSRPGVGSPRETELRLDLVERGLPEPLVGNAIWIEAIQRHLTPDLYYPQIATAIEYEGIHHWSLRDQARYDVERSQAFRSAGIYVERVVAGVPLASLFQTVVGRFDALAAGTFVPPHPA